MGTAAGAGPRHLAFHPNGRFAYLLNELNSTMTVFEYDAATGGLSEIETLATLPAGYDGDNYAADVKVLSTGDFLYTTNRIHDSIAVFAIDAGTGRATLVGHAGCGGSWPWNLGIDPSGRFLLSANFESGNVVVFEIDRATGMLKQTGHEAAVAHAVNVAFWVG
ncbi:MAG: hypothetical protein CMJ49_03705 [Planctomycetaceae bacterium]|nr:hypothetical protein [Planctomycetaceae bacterium]